MEKGNKTALRQAAQAETERVDSGHLYIGCCCECVLIVEKDSCCSNSTSAHYPQCASRREKDRARVPSPSQHKSAMLHSND